MQHPRRPIAHYGRVLLSAQQMERWSTEDLRTVERELAARQHCGWLTAKERHELHAAQAVLQSRGYGLMRACFCSECVRWRAQVALELAG